MSTTVSYMPANGKVNCRLPQTYWLTSLERFGFLYFLEKGKIIHYSTSPRDSSDTSADQPEPMIVF